MCSERQLPALRDRICALQHRRNWLEAALRSDMHERLRAGSHQIALSLFEDFGVCGCQQVTLFLQSFSKGGGKSGLGEVDDYSGTILPTAIAKSLTSSQKMGYLTYFTKGQ